MPDPRVGHVVLRLALLIVAGEGAGHGLDVLHGELGRHPGLPGRTPTSRPIPTSGACWSTSRGWRDGQMMMAGWSRPAGRWSMRRRPAPTLIAMPKQLVDLLIDIIIK